jgi:TolA-binding protein
MTRLDALFRRIANEQDELRAADRLEERLIGRLRQSLPSRRRSSRRWVAALAAAAALLVAGTAAVVEWNRTALDVEIGEAGAGPLIGAWLGAPEKKTLPLRFSDGSRFDLAPGSKARLVELRRGGARLELASGTVKVHVIPRPAANYRLDAGPFGVHVKGTRFEMSYRPDSDVFELFLEEGQVELTGCAFGKGRKLAAGQSVRASCSKQAVDVTYGRPRRGPEVASAPRSASPSGVKEAPSPEPASTETPNGGARVDHRAAAQAPPSGAPAAWVVLAKKGAYEEAFSAVRAQGFEAECARADSQTLALLADVARHAGAKRQAEQALVTLRKRFPGTGDAALAAFALGRLEFDEFHAYPRAAQWFRAYLNERPSGPMAREALGRLIEACYRARDTEGARTAAVRYLREYPSGPHAELASRVAASP